MNIKVDKPVNFGWCSDVRPRSNTCPCLRSANLCHQGIKNEEKVETVNEVPPCGRRRRIFLVKTINKLHGTSCGTRKNNFLSPSSLGGIQGRSSENLYSWKRENKVKQFELVSDKTRKRKKCNIFRKAQHNAVHWPKCMNGG